MKSFNSVLFKKFSKTTKSEILTDVTAYTLQQRIKKAKGTWKIADTSDYRDAVKSLKSSEKSTYMEKFAMGVNLHSEVVVSPKFKRKGEVYDKYPNGYAAASHKNIRRALVGKTMAYAIECKNGDSIYVWQVKSVADMNPEFRNEVFDAKTTVCPSTVIIPNVEFEKTIDYVKALKLDREDVKLGELSLQAYESITEFSLDAEGAKVKQRSVMRLTKSAGGAPKNVIIKPPFVVSIVRDGNEIFSAKIEKDSLIKR